jgi:hypothetical protein
LKVLVACEYSGVVRVAFRAKGHDAWSCDIIESEDNSEHHYHCKVEDIIDRGWDLMIAHPPCTYLTVAGNKWLSHPDDKDLPELERRPHPLYPTRRKDMEDAVEFVKLLYNAPIKKICVENPIGRLSTLWRKPDQIIQPFHHGHEARKPTCLWLKGLPPLLPTKIVGEGDFSLTRGGKKLPKWYNLPPSEDRWKERSRTFTGIAAAMADQWG